MDVGGTIEVEVDEVATDEAVGTVDAAMAGNMEVPEDKFWICSWMMF